MVATSLQRKPLSELVQSYLTPQPHLRHVLTADMFTPELCNLIFERALEHGYNVFDQRRHSRMGSLLEGHMMYEMFEKESTRTFESHGFAGEHLGMAVRGTQGIQFSSRAKGESLHDTVMALACYLPDIIVFRSANEGAAAEAAAISPVPIINAGDGGGEHPTQALLDLFTIQQEVGRVSKLHVVMGGDMYNGRTVRSLVRLLIKYPDNRFTFVSPSVFGMRRDILDLLDAAGVEYTQTEDKADALRGADVVYWTRVQAERMTDEQKAFSLAPKAFDAYQLNRSHLALMPAHARLLHPLPRVGEITVGCDSSPKSAYFRQMFYGMLVRMALIEWVLGYLD